MKPTQVDLRIQDQCSMVSEPIIPALGRLRQENSQIKANSIVTDSETKTVSPSLTGPAFWRHAPTN